MQRFLIYCHVFLLAFVWLHISPAFADAKATAIVKAAIDYWRDENSCSVSKMTIHRPDWERAMTMRVWTMGMKNSLVRVIKPKKDKDNANLITNDKMWAYSPKISRIIKIPSSMMSQSWMGSDFSNNDVAKADSLLENYTHTLNGTESHWGRTVYVIEAVPFEDAPVVWGKEVVKISDDYLLLEHAFYDQDNVLVKKMETKEIRLMGDKLIVTKQRMEKVDVPDEWTEIVVQEARFKINVPSNTFTQSNLRNPRSRRCQ